MFLFDLPLLKAFRNYSGAVHISVAEMDLMAWLGGLTAPASIYIRFMNTSLLLKWICKLFNEPNGSLWQRFFLKKYLPDGSFIFMSVKKGSQL
jgi:hypothetical protein